MALTSIMAKDTDRRELIRRRAVEGIEDVFPLKARGHHVEVRNVHVQPKQFSSREQKDAILHGRTLQEPLRGDLVLKDGRGKTVETQKNVTLAQLPYFTPRHTFIVDGNEYTVSHQRRVRPGVYTRVRGNEELEATFNLAKGENFRLNMSPEKGHLYMQYGSSRIPLYPVLRGLGVSDKQIRQHWGSGVVDINKDAFDKKREASIKKLYERLVPSYRRTASTPESMSSAIDSAYRETAMDEEVTRKTLGQGFKRVTPNALLRASKKLLDVHRAGEETDDRDSLAFQTLHGVDDFFKERIQLEGRNLARKVAIKASGQTTPTLERVVPASPFTRSLRSFVTNANLSAIPSQINPVEILDSAVRITSLGEGGISSERAVPPEARNLHSTHLGIIDPVRTPECYVKDMEVFTLNGWKYWPDVTEDDYLACNIAGHLHFYQPTHLVNEHYKGLIYGVKTGKIHYAVTPNHRVWCNFEEGSRWRTQRADEVHGAWSRCFDTRHAPLRPIDPLEVFQLPTVTSLNPMLEPPHGGRLNNNLVNVGPIRMTDWAAFMGWYLSEGNVTYDENYPTYRVNITQSREANPTNYEMIRALLDRLPFAWSVTKETCFHIAVKQLASYLKDFGYCYDKYIPDYFFETTIEARETLLETLILGDGRVGSHRQDGRSYDQRIFCTTSPRLAKDFERLAISLGLATRTARYVDQREERYLDVYEVRILQHRYRHARRQDNNYFVEEYDDRVYCAEVPGNLLYVRRGNSVPIWCGNSFRAGVDLRGTIWTHRDEQGQMFTKLRNARTGRTEYVPIGKLEESTIAFPGEMKRRTNIGVLQQGYVRSVPKGEVDYEVIHPAGMYGPTTNLVPMPESLQGNRTVMGSKMATQALPLVGREAPYIQVASSRPGRSFEEEIADLVLPTAPVDGVVKKVDKDYIYIQPERTKKSEELLVEQHHVEIDREKTAAASPLVKIPYDDNFPLASKTYLHNDLKVKAGDRVSKGQQLAESNFTRDGSLALGRNMRVGYMAYYGANSNDAVVISEGASKKLTSEHMYKEMLPLDNDITLDKRKHRAQFPNKWTAAQYANLDDRGIAKQGATINPGDPVVLALRKVAPTAEMAMLGKLHRTLATPFREEALTWSHKAPGVVQDVVVTGSRAVVTIKTNESAGIGDKISGRFGNKGVISKIIPDDQMVQTKDGKPLDILMTSAGIISRVNPAQIVETAAAKVAEKTGKRIIVPSLSGRNNVKWAKDLLKEHGLTDKEVVHNPLTGRDIVGPDGKGVMVGPQYIYKLFKSTDTNYSARGVEDYDVNLQPAKGGEDGAKGLGRMEINALLAHGTRNVLQEAATLKSTRNDAFWRAYQLGRPLPPPKPSFAYDKLGMMLGGAGIKFDKSNEQVTLGPLTDADIRKMSSGALTKATMVRERDLNPEKGGLFDPVVTGGTQGTRWSHVDLREPIVNPTFEEPVRRLLGYTQNDFRHAVANDGGQKIRDRLKKLDLEAKEKELRAKVRTATGSQLDGAVKQLKYLKALKAEGLRPDEAYTLSRLPVVPPVARPIMPSRGKRDLLVSDANYLYRDTMLANEALGEVKQTQLPEEIGRARLQLYDTTRAVFGLADPVSPQLRGRKARGFISTISGQGSPKSGFFHGKMLKLPQDLSGRGTAIPDLALNMDQIGLPEEMMWKTFQPHLIRSMVQKGYKAVDAQRMVEERHPVARDALVAESKRRPVLVNRAPTLHRYGIVGAYAVPVPGKTIRVNPFIEQGTNLDYDGDCADCALDTWQDGRYTRIHISEFPRVEESVKKNSSKEVYEVPPGVQVFSYDEETGRVVLRDVTHFSVHHNLEMLDVTLSSKRHVKVSRDASMYAVNPETWQVQRVSAEDAIGWATPRPRKLHQERASLSKLPLSRHTWQLDRDLGWFLGAFAGDGWLSYSQGNWSFLGLAKSDPGVKKAYVEYAQALIDTPLSVKRYDTLATDPGSYGNSCKYHLNSRELARKVAELMDGVRGAENKHLPRCFVNAPRPFLLGLLGGLIDTDGSIAKVKAKAKPNPQWTISYTTVSERLADEICVLLTMLGIKSNSCPNPKREGRRQAYTVVISMPDFARVAPEVSLVHTRKRMLLQQLVKEFNPEGAQNTPWDIIPIDPACAAALSRALRYPTHEDTPEKRAQRTLYAQLRKSTKTRRLSRLGLQRTVDRLGVNHVISEGGDAWFNLVTNENIFFDFIVSAELLKGRHTAWDLTVPGSNTFMTSNQVIVYDTLQIHVPVSDKATQEVKATTMSNLLFGDRTKSELMVMPQHEAILGVYAASAAKGGKTHTFKNQKEALEAYRRGEVALHDSVKIG